MIGRQADAMIATVRHTNERAAQKVKLDVENSKNMHSEGRMNDNYKYGLLEGLHKNAKARQEYTNDHPVCHIVKGSSVKYIVRWYCNTCVDHTNRQPDNIPGHFITLYSRWVVERCLMNIDKTAMTKNGGQGRYGISITNYVRVCNT